MNWLKQLGSAISNIFKKSSTTKNTYKILKNTKDSEIIIKNVGKEILPKNRTVGNIFKILKNTKDTETIRKNVEKQKLGKDKQNIYTTGKKLLPKNKLTRSIFNVISERTSDIRKTAIQQEKINLAKEFSTLGKQSESKASLFYMATQRLWEGYPAAERNKIIIKKLGVTNLEEAYKIVMNREDVKKALKDIQKFNKKNKSTKEDPQYINKREEFMEEIYQRVMLVGL